MTTADHDNINPQLDLVLERIVDVPRELVWKAWTTPEHVKKWFCPAPWSVSQCEIDLRPGGVFRTVMKSPEGEEHPHDGCYLEIVPGQKLIWTDALLPGYRPAEKPFITAIIMLEDHGSGTKYTALVKHKDAATREEHEKMGFSMGWNTALDQLVALAKTM